MVQMLLSPRVTQLPGNLLFHGLCLGWGGGGGQVTCLSLAGRVMDAPSARAERFH